MNRADEQRLVQAASQGDREAFAALYQANVNRILQYIRRRVDGEMLAEDLTSDVFLHALVSVRRYQYRGRPFVHWLYRIARARVADYYRRLLHDPDIIHLDDVYVAVLPDLDTRIMEQELTAYLHKIIIALTEDQQQVVVLRFAEDRSIKEVARIMCRQPNAVKQLQHRALRQIQGRLDRSGFVAQVCGI